MNTLPRTVATILLMAPFVSAQQIRNEVTQPANPVEDAWPNSDKVPNSYSVTTRFEPARLGFCLDTCHLLAAGYDFRTRQGYARMMAAWDDLVGIERIRVIHLNDSKKDLGSRVDRHEHIGQGYIGTKGFEFLLNDRRLAGLPMVLETPKDDNADVRNLQMLRSLIR